MKPAAALSIFLLSSSLAACGGGGSGDTGTITPVNGDLSNQPVGATNEKFAATIRAGGVNLTSAFSSRNDLAAQLKIASDFSVSLETSTASFANAESISELETNAPGLMHLTAYRYAGGDAVVVLNSPNGAPSVGDSLDYATFGVWMTGDQLDLANGRTGLDASDAGAFYGGNATALKDMPTTGSFTYRGSVVAAESDLNSGTSQLLSGQVTMTTDFASRSIDAAFDLTDNGGFLIVGDDLTISGNTFAGDLISTDGHNGSTAGIFAGPNAEELAGAFTLDGPQSSVEGAFGAAR